MLFVVLFTKMLMVQDAMSLVLNFATILTVLEAMFLIVPIATIFAPLTRRVALPFRLNYLHNNETFLPLCYIKESTGLQNPIVSLLAIIIS